MKYLKIAIIPLLLVSFTVQEGQAKIVKKVAQTGFQFLKIGMPARIVGMGGAASMAVRGADATFYNPAGMSEMTYQYDGFVTRTDWIADISYTGGALAADLGTFGHLGVNVISANYGDILGTRVADNEKGFVETGNVEVGAYSIGVFYSRQLTNKFLIGGAVKYNNQNLGEVVSISGGAEELTPGTARAIHNELSTLAFDFGTIFYPGFHSLKVGMSIRNFSPEVRYAETGFELPLNFRIGASMDMMDLVGGIDNSSLLLSIDALHPRDYTERLHFGTEYWYANTIALRAGYKMNYDEQDLSLGFGLKYEIAGTALKFDYAYSNFGVFNSVNRITIGAAF